MNDEVGRAGGLFFRFCLRFRLSPFCFTFFTLQSLHVFPPRSHSLFSRFNCFSDGGGDEQAPSHFLLLLIVHCRRRESHVDSGRGRRRRRVTAPAVGGRGGGGEGRRAAARRTAAASGTCPLTCRPCFPVATNASRDIIRFRFVFGGVGPREDDGKDRCTGAAVSLF